MNFGKQSNLIKQKSYARAQTITPKQDLSEVFIPIQITELITNEYKGRIDILDEENCIYGKALIGRGSMQFPNGNRYEGEFHRGMIHGEGRMVFANGIIYEGEFNCNCIEGKGVLKWRDGSVYQGEFVNGVRCGHGVFTNEKERVRYEGNWSSGKREGFGTLILADGSRYEGEFLSGVKHGHGKMMFPSGNFYEGAWNYNKKNGQGLMNWVSHKEIYSGNWTDDYPHGQGNLVWLEDKGETKVMRNRYSGEFYKGCRQGLGVFYYANGATYEGEFFDNKKNGYAVYTDENGVIIKAVFENDRITKVIDTTDELNGQEGMSVSKNNFAKSETVFDPLRKPIKEEDNDDDKASKKESDTTQQQRTGLDHPKDSNNEDTSKPYNMTAKRVETNILKLNPYTKFINIDDQIGNMPRGKPLLDKICEVLLRHNSSIKTWFKIYSRRLAGNEEEFKEGFFMRLNSFHKFLNDNRLVNGKLSLIHFNRCFEQGYKNRFLLDYNKPYLNKLICEVKKMDWDANTDLEISNAQQSDKQKDTAQEAKYLEEYGQERIFAADVNNPDRPMLLRHFVDAIVRALYLKNSGFANFPTFQEHMLANRVGPIMSNRMRPKQIISDEDAILERSKKIIEHYGVKFRKIYDTIVKNIKEPMYSHKLMMIKHFLWFMQQFGFIDYDAFEDKQMFWHVVERNDDPEQSVFKILKKSVGRKPTDPFWKIMKDRLTSKSMIELTYEDFCEHFIIFFSKKNQQNSKSNIFERKFRITMDETFKNIDKQMEDYFNTNMKKEPIHYPITKKDKDLKNISEIKEQKAKALEAKKKAQKEKENEFKERRLLQKFDYDISDKMAKKVELSEDDIEEDEGEAQSEAIMDDDSYFIHDDDPNFNRGGTAKSGQSFDK